MIIKTTLCVIFVFATTLIGVKLTYPFKARKNVFEVLSKFNSSFKSRLQCFSPSLEESLMSLKKQLPETFDGVEKIFDGETFECVDKRLTVSQRKLVSEYVNSLGSVDTKSQMELLSVYGQAFSAEKNASEENEKKFSTLGVKLGFSIGLAVVVVIV